MSDSESAQAPGEHPTLGGKSLQNLSRPRYKSWRKKYRKMRARFDVSLEENKSLFKEETKLESIAKRLREELDGLLDLCLEINGSPALPPELRFDVSCELPHHLKIPMPMDDLTPEKANEMMRQCIEAVQTKNYPPEDIPIVRGQLVSRLAAQDVEKLNDLESNIPHAVASSHLPTDLTSDEPTSYFSLEQEAEYLSRLDGKLGGDNYSLQRPKVLTEGEEKEKEKASSYWAELTPRELERQTELSNPHSQHNWLKNHTKLNPPALPGDDDNESLFSAPQEGSKKKRNGPRASLAKRVGDRAVERAREAGSPAVGGSEGEEDEEEVSRKRGRDPDGTYRLKGGKGGASKAKRKRSGEDVGSAGAEKKVRVESVEG